MDIQQNIQYPQPQPQDEQFQLQVQPQQQNQNQSEQLSVATKQNKKYQMPIQFYKAKRTLTKMVNQYFSNLRQEFIKTNTNVNGIGKFIYDRQQIHAVQIAISKLATIRYTDLMTLVPKKSEIIEDFLLSYISESNKIIKYNQNIGNSNAQKPKQIIIFSNQQNCQLPDSATPAAFGANAYFFDGSQFDFKRMVYTPVKCNYKVNLISGQITKLSQQPPFFRMKCCIIKVKHGFFIIGGYAGPEKSLTKQCLFYSIQHQKFHQIQNVNLFHNCPSGCVHNNKIYIFSRNGIEYFQQNQNRWIVIQIPRRLKCLAFQYCVSVAHDKIMIIGGKVNNQNSTDIKIYNTQTNYIDQYSDMLPVGVCNQRSWGPMIINNFITVMSNIQASIYPQVTVKRDAVQMILIGFGGCFLNTLMASQ